jgi:hypothetical protein
MGKNQLEVLLQQAQEQGQLHSRGSFSLDLASASRQFGQYALTEPIAVVARLIRVGALCGGTVQVELTAKATKVQIAGHWAAVSSLAQSFHQVLTGDPADREFAIALNSIVNHPFQDLRIFRGEPGQIGQLLMNSEREVEVADAVNLAQDLYFTQIQWKTPKARAVANDLDKLRRWFRYCRVPVFLNGKELDTPMGPPRGPGFLKHYAAPKQVWLKRAWYALGSYFWSEHQALEFRLYSNQEERNEVGLPTPGLASCRAWAGSRQPSHWGQCYLALSFLTDLSLPSRIEWVHRGQLLENEPAQFSLPAVNAVVSCHGLNMDLLGEKPVHNQAFDARRQFIRDWVNCIEEELAPRFRDADRNLMHRVLFDSHLRGNFARLPNQGRVQELLRRLNPVHPGA